MAVAMACVAYNAGGVLATWLFGALSSAPEYRIAIVVCLAFSVGAALLAGVSWWYLAVENRKKAARREELIASGNREGEGEEEGMGDRSVWFVYNL